MSGRFELAREGRQRVDRVRLSAQCEAFAADDAWIGLDEILDRSAVMTKLVRTAVEDPGPLPLTEDDALAIARASGGRATGQTRYPRSEGG